MGIPTSMSFKSNFLLYLTLCFHHHLHWLISSYRCIWVYELWVSVDLPCPNESFQFSPPYVIITLQNTIWNFSVTLHSLEVKGCFFLVSLVQSCPCRWCWSQASQGSLLCLPTTYQLSHWSSIFSFSPCKCPLVSSLFHFPFSQFRFISGHIYLKLARWQPQLCKTQFVWLC